MAVAIGFNSSPGCSATCPATPPRCRARPRSASSSTPSPVTPHTSLTSCNSTATTLVELRSAPRLHRHHRLVEHPGRQAADARRAARQGRSRRLLDLLLHQLPAHAAACRGLVPRLRQGRLRRRRRPHPGVRVRARRLERRAQAAALGVRYPVADRRRLRDLERLRQRVLAGRLPDRRAGRRPPRPLRRGRLRDDRAADPPAPRRPIRACRLPPATGVPEPHADRGDEPGDLRRLRAAAVPVDHRRWPENAPADYHFPTSLPLGGAGLSGTWTEHAQEATAGAGAPSWSSASWPRTSTWCSAAHGTLDVSVDGNQRRPSTSAACRGCTRSTRLARPRAARSCCRPHRASRPTTSPSAEIAGPTPGPGACTGPGASDHRGPKTVLERGYRPTILGVGERS